ncbi:peptide chain release factor N(5)-glutamine methyltransferase [Anaerocolumna aminovalerica]|jgi:release factor glutamine methyltransferase|uniref:Release factor glutamine methyltransferase n=1 Tax=Anaerocolumna aminovalerica TaxID=1527 RepID=A0A1I5GZZ3_9FIRM|nr:peptide chain release factor N(5)-glutamine methyltransferase [Anaerocolumna aminovalerica]MDU6266512.1 peptide chain release factor N(5)-glutamine methyltransferase [Anaerocolumna aminovalerica]SFO41628.1 release factor glutamine methyltransferase [Anaerocolumna aminovalerica]
MKTLENALQEGRKFLKEKQIADSDIDAWYLLSFLFKMDRARYLMHSSMPISQVEYHEYMELVKKRGNHIPLQHITGEQEFMGLNFKVSKDVLIPRQDTEILVQEVLKTAEGKNVLDMCTGSGCIIISLDKLGNIKSGVGVDISEAALKIANENNTRLETKVQFLQSNLFEQVRGKYDIIVSNPPYIPTSDIETLMDEVKEHEPPIALDGKEDGLYFYRCILSEGTEYMNPGGFIFFEIGWDQGMAVSRLLKEKGFQDIRIIKDLAGLDRVVTGRYVNQEEPFT